MSVKKPENIGVINPYALAEIKLRKRIAWTKIQDPQKLLERTLKLPYQKLFDPVNNSPLYEGIKYEPTTKRLKKVDFALSKRIESSPVPSSARMEFGIIPTALKLDLKWLAYDVWVDPGDYFEEGAEMTDPIQGGVANCYFIAALSSVAWAHTYRIAQRSRSTNVTGGFVDMVPFYKAGKEEKVEVTELIPMTSFGTVYKYARSTDPGEIWPSVYEKAYAKWITNDPGDKPDILATAYGDPVGAAAQLTGLSSYYYWTAQQSADAIWSKVRSKSISHKTFNPIVAWTYSSGNASPDNVNYANANLVANHAYSILGWQYANNQKYVVLRNPWGTKEATLTVEGGSWIAWDAPYYGGPGFWRTIGMATSDGIFALRVDTFKKYFAGFGLVK